MLVSASHKPVATLKKAINDMLLPEVSDVNKLTPDLFFSADILAERGPSLKIYKSPSASKTFAIKFSYLRQVYYTKVLKISHNYAEPFYKVMLRSNISTGAPICWLQRQLQGWTVLLGDDLDERLKQAITFAIECREETGLI